MTSDSPPPERQAATTDQPRTYGAMRTVRAIAIFLLIAAAIAGAIGVMATSPWTRATPDCSVYCVIAEKLNAFFGGPN